MIIKYVTRIYDAEDCIVFRKTSDPFGGLSNMAPGFPIELSGIHCLTAEALYQACRFPDCPDLQRDIIKQRSPMHAKDISRRFESLSRSDWEDVRLITMMWVLRAKLLCNWCRFGELLKATGDKIIVEHSERDLFWGATKKGSIYTGVNALGRLLMHLRQQYLAVGAQACVKLPPPHIPKFFLLGATVDPLYRRVDKP